MRTDIDVVHVIFKTHLDVGFTDYARSVIDRYMTHFIPDAIALAREMKEHHPSEPFRWTVGSWLIYEYLERATPEQQRQMEQAIADDLVAWHAAPFTTHTELMDARLFRFGLSLSQELDRRYGKQTISAKMTDVPGHTRAMIPLLAEAGVRFFHVGVNPAATVPDVPPVFIWRDPASATEVLMMYQQVYGDVMILPGTSEAVALVFTGDNLGPPSSDSVRATYAHLREQFPNATFVGSTLDAVARSILDARSELPVITSEIGDTWIHGIGTDPTKVSRYRELLRLRENWIAEGRIEPTLLGRMQRALLMIPEHTWGMDLKTHLRDYEHYSTPALALKRGDPAFRAFEASWTEQRAYVDDAINALEGSPLKAEAQTALRDLTPRRPELSAYQPTSETHFETDRWSIVIDRAAGAIARLEDKSSGRVLAESGRPLGLFTYETFSTADYDRYWHQYIRDREFGEVRVWAHPDNTKPGLQVDAHGIWYPVVKTIYTRRDADGLRVLVSAALPEDSQAIGAPKEVCLEYRFAADSSIALEVQWFDKPACRLPEAFWLTFQPATTDFGAWAIRKLGGEIDPTDVINNGARTLHGFNERVSYREPAFKLDIRALDAVLVAPGKPSLLNFHNQLPDMTGGVHFNLFNNIWGTNFPMWFEEDAHFRFSLEFAASR